MEFALKVNVSPTFDAICRSYVELDSTIDQKIMLVSKLSDSNTPSIQFRDDHRFSGRIEVPLQYCTYIVGGTVSNQNVYIVFKRDVYCNGTLYFSGQKISYPYGQRGQQTYIIVPR